MRLLLDGDLNPLGNRELDWMRVAERENHVLALDLGAISDADDIEILLESRGDAGDSVGDERARQAMQRAKLLGFALGDEGAVLLLERDSARHADGHLALGALHVHGAVLDLNLHAGRHWNYLVSNSRHGSMKTSFTRLRRACSPPTPSFRADWPVINPRGVDRIEMPMPPTTGRIPVLPT